MRRAAHRVDPHPAVAHRSRDRAGAARPGPGAGAPRLHPHGRLVHLHRARAAHGAHRPGGGRARGRRTPAGRVRARRLRTTQVSQPADGPAADRPPAGAVQLPRPGQRVPGAAHHRRRPGQPVRRRGQRVDRRGHRKPARGVHPRRGHPRRDHRALAERAGARRGRLRDGRAHGTGHPAPAGPVLPGPDGGHGRTLRRAELVHLRPASGHRRAGRGDGVRDRAAPGRGRRLHHRRRRKPGPGPQGGPAGRRPHGRSCRRTRRSRPCAPGTATRDSTRASRR